MAIRLINGAEFLHIPKTGGTWVKAVLKGNDLVSEYLGHKHDDYDRNLLRSTLTGQQHLKEATRLAREKIAKRFGYSSRSDSDNVFRFCFVRHPLSWYESWWKYMNRMRWNNWGTQNSQGDWHPNSILNELGSNDFNEFVQNVVKERPGYVSELLFAYTKPGISFIGKTENIREDLADVLDILDLQYDRSMIEKSAKKNVSKTDQTEIQWDSDLRAMVMRLELPALIHFDYLTEEEKSDLGIDMTIMPNKALHRSSVRGTI